MWIIVLMAVALVIGVWVGLGSPGWKGLREDRIVTPGRARRLEKKHIDLLRRQRRH